jgi:hypothetical protein
MRGYRRAASYFPRHVYWTHGIAAAFFSFMVLAFCHDYLRVFSGNVGWLIIVATAGLLELPWLIYLRQPGRWTPEIVDAMFGPLLVLMIAASYQRSSRPLRYILDDEFCAIAYPIGTLLFYGAISLTRKQGRIWILYYVLLAAWCSALIPRVVH